MAGNIGLLLLNTIMEGIDPLTIDYRLMKAEEENEQEENRPV